MPALFGKRPLKIGCEHLAVLLLECAGQHPVPRACRFWRVASWRRDVAKLAELRVRQSVGPLRGFGPSDDRAQVGGFAACDDLGKYNGARIFRLVSKPKAVSP